MKPTKLAMVLLIISIGNLLIAQSISSPSKPKHQKYQLIDLGTLGGANSSINGTPPPMLNNRGIVAGEADTAQTCYYFDGPVSPAVRWDNGAPVNLGVLPGGCFSLPNAINSKAMLVGSGDIGFLDPATGLPVIHADFRYKGQILDLGTFGGNNSLATDVNERGDVVGGAENSEPDPWNFGDLFLGIPSPTAWHAFLWQAGVMRDLGTLGGLNSFAVANNERGQAAGISFTTTAPNPATGLPTIDPFLWDGKKMIDLGTLGGTIGFGNGLNNQGQVVGQSNLEGDHTHHAFIWDRGVLTEIGTFGGSKSVAFWINNAGQVVGNANLPDGTHHGFVWWKGKMTDIGTIADDPCSNAFDINARGQVIGTTADCHANILHFFVWQDGIFTDLGAQVLPGSNFATVEPVVINDAGEIVGLGNLLNGDVHVVLIQPVGDCDDACEASMADAQKSATATPRKVATSMTALQDSTPSTMLERLQHGMRQRYTVPGRR
jgi:probable HAF family extracellular repeat protein